MGHDDFMARLLFVLPDVEPGDTVRLDTMSGSNSPSTDVVPTGGGQAITGGVLHADDQGHLPRVLGPAAGTSTLYLKTLTYRGTVTGSPTTLTGIDPHAAPDSLPESGVAGLIADLNNRAPITVAITSQAADYTLVLADAGTEVEGSKGTAQTVTIPPNSAVAFPVGTTINVRQMGAGQITVAAGAGVTLRAPNGAKTAHQYSTVGLIKRATDEWVLGGDTTT